MTLFDPMPEVTDFADTAAIIANLDLVITVDTSVLHLAAAMGKPVFLLDRYDHCWRWLSGRQDSPWYPSLRIFRQSRIGEWGPVLQQATAALEMFAKATISQGR
jgi:ADP-heptose:LPS heptosyltransferase